MILRYVGSVGIKGDGAMSISKSSDPINVSISANSLAGDKARESSAKVCAPR